MKLRFAPAADLTDTGADQSFTLDVAAPLNTNDFHTSNDEGHLHQAELANLAAMARSIFHQVEATEVAQPELTTLVNFNGTDGIAPVGSLIADAHGDLFGTTFNGGANTNEPYFGLGTVFEIAKTAHGYASTPTTLVSFNGTNGAYPSAGLIADTHGDLFGTTNGGGTNGVGTVFEIAKTAHGYASTPTTLVNHLFLPNDDTNLIATFHYYDPMRFTHQGASWISGADQWKNITWTGTAEERETLKGNFEKAAAWGRANQRPLYLGEFGSFQSADMDSRARWTSAVAREAEKRGINWAYWEFCSSFGAYDARTNAWRRPLLEALIPQ